jgi:Ribonuclease G/E
MALEVFRTLILASSRDEIRTIRITVVEEVAEYLNNRKRVELAKVERDGNVEITIKGTPDIWPEHLAVDCFDVMGQPVAFSAEDSLKPQTKQR